jgi:sarcosine oxidase subunit gamma
LKGPLAASWLEQRSVAVPDRPNSWCPLADDERDIVVRLGASEFLLEQIIANTKLSALADELSMPITGVYPVLREDSAFVLGGVAADAVLAEVCNVNFSELLSDQRHAVMTMMIGVAVTVVPQGKAAQRRYLIWCDPTYGDYLWSSLQAVITDLGTSDGEHI